MESQLYGTGVPTDVEQAWAGILLSYASALLLPTSGAAFVFLSTGLLLLSAILAPVVVCAHISRAVGAHEFARRQSVIVKVATCVCVLALAACSTVLSLTGSI